MRVKQIFFDRKAVVVDGYIKKSGIRTTYNKKGTEDKPKLRVVLYPDLTLNLLEAYIRDSNIGSEDYVFTYEGLPISQSMASTAFNLALVKSGIAWDKETLIKKGHWKGGHLMVTRELIPDGRRLIPHSLRYNYVTRMSEEIDARDLQKLTGHASVEQVNYYNRRNLERLLAKLPDAGMAANALLPQAIGKM